MQAFINRSGEHRGIVLSKVHLDRFSARRRENTARPSNETHADDTAVHRRRLFLLETRDE